MVQEAVCAIPWHYPAITLEKYVIMPNHIHLLLCIRAQNGRMVSAPTGDAPTFRPKALSVVIGQMKRAASKQVAAPLWQKGFYDHIIRDEADYLRVCNYMDTNPAKWAEDRYFSSE